jgi:GcrA cell cycle regulator
MARKGRSRDPVFVAKFTTLWESGMTTALMGERLGVSKNAVCGIRNRLDLPQRPGAIKPLPDGAPPKAPALAPLPAPALAPLPSLAAPPPPAVAVPPPPPRSAPAQPPLPPPVVATEFVPRPRPWVIDDGKLDDGCCYPIGTPGRSGFRFCGDRVRPPENGRRQSYCVEHQKLTISKNQPRARPDDTSARLGV